MSIVVTGATGHLGRLVVDALLERDVPADQVVTVGRSLDQVAGLATRGVRTARVDYDEPSTLEAALSPGDTLLFVSASDPGRRLQQHLDTVAVAAKVGVARIVYTSATRADDTPLVLAPDHRATEGAIRDSGLPFTVLRNNWYTENYAQALAQARENGVLLASVGDGRVASATRADYAAATAVVLTTDGHEGATYELSGDEAWTHDELAAALTDVLGREVTYRRAFAEEHLVALIEAGLDEQTAGFVVLLDGNIRDGALDLVTGELSRLLGRPTTSLVDGLRPLLGSAS